MKTKYFLNHRHRTLPADGGGGVSPPLLLSAKLMNQLSIRKRCLIAPGLNMFKMLNIFLSEYVVKFYLNVTDDVTGQANVFFISVIARFAGQRRRIKMERHGSCLGYF